MASSIPSNNWDVTSRKWFTDLNDIEEALPHVKKEHNGKMSRTGINYDNLSRAQIETCTRVLNEWSALVAPLSDISDHPVLRNLDFYQNVKFLKDLETENPLAENQVFQGCEKIAKGLNSPVDVQEKPDWKKTAFAIKPEAMNKFNWMERDGARTVLNFVAECRSQAPLNALQIERCKAIFNAIKEYIKPMRPLLDCTVFEEKEFYQTCYPLFGKVAGSEGPWNNIIERLLYMRLPQDALSAVSTPASTPNAKRDKDLDTAPPTPNSPTIATLEKAQKELEKAQGKAEGPNGAKKNPIRQLNYSEKSPLMAKEEIEPEGACCCTVS